MIEVHMAS